MHHGVATTICKKGEEKCEGLNWTSGYGMGDMGRNGGSHRQRRESDNWTEKHTDKSAEREFEEEPEETGRQVGTGRHQAALLSERLTKLDSTVVVRAVRVPSSGGAEDERKGVRGTGASGWTCPCPKP